MVEQLENLTEETFANDLAAAWPVVFARLAARYGDPQLAEEVSGDCLAQAWEKWAGEPDFFRSHDLTAWSSRRAGWKAVDRLRQRTRIRPLPEKGSEDGEEGVRPRRENDSRERARARELALACLGRLPEQERTILLAYHFDGLTDQEVGAVLYGEEGTAQARGLRVWRLRQRAYNLLRELLIEEGVDPADWGGLAV